MKNYKTLTNLITSDHKLHELYIIKKVLDESKIDECGHLSVSLRNTDFEFSPAMTRMIPKFLTNLGTLIDAENMEIERERNPLYKFTLSDKFLNPEYKEECIIKPDDSISTSKNAGDWFDDSNTIRPYANINRNQNSLHLWDDDQQQNNKEAQLDVDTFWK